MFEKVSKMLAEQLKVEESKITPEAEVVKDLGADSLDIVELMMALEDEYGVTLPEGRVESVKTVQDIVDMLEEIEK
ncbi:MAG: acyl carrier protein [Clostridia bacterium]|nr:acyl carrier protein [Clostridia bacterium]